MLDEFHAAVYSLIDSLTDIGVWDHIPDDVNEVPCVVVGNPQARESNNRVVFLCSIEVFVIGRRQQAGGNSAELRGLVDWLWSAFNGTRAKKSSGYVLTIRNLVPRVLSIAGLDCPAYSVTVDSELATC